MFLRYRAGLRYTVEEIRAPGRNMKKPDPQTRKLFERTLKQQSRPVTRRLPPRVNNADDPAAKGRVNCHACVFFQITWDKARPYACKAHGFKSAQLPSMVVFANSGQHCLLFRQKNPG